MLSAATLGVDFGTSHTVAILRRTDGVVMPLLFDGSPLLASAVYAEGPEELVAGRDASHSARLRPERFEPHPKRCVDDGTVLLGDNEFEVTELFAAVLSRVRAEAERVAGALPPRTVVTHPATWGPVRRLVLADACRSAGLAEVTLVPEPVAAARYFATELDIDIAPGSAVVVYDFGGGTFDTSVVAATETGFEVLAVDGSDTLGGVDIDQALATHIGLRFADDDRWAALMNPTDAASRRHRRTFMEDVRAAKERLSRQNRVDLLIPMLDVDTQITREELESITGPLLDKAVRLTKAVMRSAAVPDDRIVGVFLVGGASRMPLAATTLHQGTGIAPTVIDQPEMVVATGATVETASVTSPIAAAVTTPGPVAAPLMSPPQFAIGAAVHSPPAPSMTAPGIPRQLSANVGSSMSATPPPGTPIPGLIPLYWVQFGLSIGMAGLILFAVIGFSMPDDYFVIGASAVAVSLILPVVIAVDAVRLVRRPGTIPGSVAVVQTVVLGVVTAMVILLLTLGGPPLVLLRAVLFAPGVVAAVILGLVRLGRPPQPITLPRLKRELTGTLIIQSALLTGTLLVVLAWWVEFAGSVGGQVRSGYILTVMVAVLLSLFVVFMLVIGVVQLSRLQVMTVNGMRLLRASQVVWLVVGAVHAPALVVNRLRLMPTDIRTVGDRQLVSEGWRDGPGDIFNDLGLWMLVAGAVAAILILVQLVRLRRTTAGRLHT